MTGKRRARIGTLIRLAIGFTLVASLALFVDVGHAFAQIRRVPPWVFLVAWLAWIGTSLAHVMRWRLALRSRGVHVPFARLLRLVVAGYFVNLFLPSAIGGDIVRVYGTKDDTAGVLQSTGVVAVERYCGFLGTFVLALPALLLTDFGARHPELAGAVVGLFVVLVAAFVVPANPRVASSLQRLSVSIGWQGLGNLIERLSLSLREFLRYPGLLAAMVFFSVVMKASIALQIWVLAKGLNIQLDISELMVFLPLYNLACSLPISISGLGTREVTMATFFAGMGVPADQAAILALLGLTWIYMSSLVAGVVFFLPGYRSIFAPVHDRSARPRGHDG